jgi:hypothetical protein
VPTLDELLGAFPTVPLLVEIKAAAAAPAVRRVLERHAAAPRTRGRVVRRPRAPAVSGSSFAIGASQHDVAALLRAAFVRPRIARPAYRSSRSRRDFRGLPAPDRALRAPPSVRTAARSTSGPSTTPAPLARSGRPA